mmetsp:Transcript_12649/g.25363  ORF Transcript_12649/g.25363 Transcript_12649/m.25363 type:complete len:164 (+) Transcript_12649:1088-1579(+)
MHMHLFHLSTRRERFCRRKKRKKSISMITMQWRQRMWDVITDRTTEDPMIKKRERVCFRGKVLVASNTCKLCERIENEATEPSLAMEALVRHGRCNTTQHNNAKDEGSNESFSAPPARFKLPVQLVGLTVRIISHIHRKKMFTRSTLKHTKHHATTSLILKGT